MADQDTRQAKETTTVADVVMRIDTAMARMGQSNPNRVLLAQCRATIVLLGGLYGEATRRLARLERPGPADQPRIILPPDGPPSHRISP